MSSSGADPQPSVTDVPPAQPTEAIALADLLKLSKEQPPAAAPPPPATAPVREIGGRSSGPEPTRYGDWEKNGRCIDF